MGILNLRKNKPPAPTKKLAVVPMDKPVVSSAPVTGSGSVLLRPRVTEKTSVLSQSGRNVYLFEVARGATKRSVSDAVRALYKVTPEKVAVLRVPAKRGIVRGHVSEGKTRYKAYVYLRAGDSIETT